MDKSAKSLFEQDTRKYAEEKQVFDILEKLMRKLIVNRPANPIEFLIDDLSQKISNSIIFLVSVDTNTNDIANNIKLQYSLKRINVPEIAQSHMKNKNEIGEELINDPNSSEILNSDKLNNSILKELKVMDKFSKGILLENFPRTLKQARFLQRNGLIPDKFFVIGKKQTINPENITNSESVLELRHALECYEGMYTFIDSENKKNDQITEEISAVLNTKIKGTVPLRPPRMVIISPPERKGFGIDQAAKSISNKYGLALIDLSTIIAREIEEKTKIGGIIMRILTKKELIPDDMICGLIYNELIKPSARINGWVLNGFPLNSKQMSKFYSWKMHPHVVVKLNSNAQQFSQKSKEIDIYKQKYLDQLFAIKIRESSDFVNEFVDELEAMEKLGTTLFGNKIEPFDLYAPISQLTTKIGNLIQNPMYYE